MRMIYSSLLCIQGTQKVEYPNMVEDQHIVPKSAEYKLLLVKLWGILNAEETNGHITVGNRPTLIRNRFFGFWDDFAKFMGEHLS